MSKEYDPFMHTAEHVLNQTMVRMFGCGRSFSSHLNADKSKCDYHFPRPLEDAEASELERRINEVLAQHMPDGDAPPRRGGQAGRSRSAPGAS